MKKAPQVPGVEKTPQVPHEGMSKEVKTERARLFEALNHIRQYGDDGRKLSHIFDEKAGGKLKNLEHQQQSNEKIREKIDEGDFDSIREMLKRNWDELDSETADKLCESGHSEMVRDNAQRFKSFSNFTYDKLKEKYDIYHILYTEGIIDKFEDYNYIVNDLIASGDISKYYANIKFKGLNNQTAKSLLSIKRTSFFEMTINEDTFTGLDKEAFNMLLNIYRFDVYKFGYIMKKGFSGLDRESFKHLLKFYDGIESYQYKAREYLGDAIIKNIGIFSGLNKTDAKNLIERGLGSAVANNLKVFKGLDKEIAELLVEYGFGWDIVDELEEFGFKKEE